MFHPIQCLLHNLSLVYSPSEMVTQPIEEHGLGRNGFPAEAILPFPFLLNEESKGNSIVAGHGKRLNRLKFWHKKREMKKFLKKNTCGIFTDINQIFRTKRTTTFQFSCILILFRYNFIKYIIRNQIN